jgi:hypothetical protein
VSISSVTYAAAALHNLSACRTADGAGESFLVLQDTTAALANVGITSWWDTWSNTVKHGQPHPQRQQPHRSTILHLLLALEHSWQLILQARHKQKHEQPLLFDPL